MTTLRPYQNSAIASLLDYWSTNGTNPLVDMATGLGKSMVVAETAKRLRQSFPTMRILMLVHVRELVRQNFEALLRVWPEAPVGIYSAGLGKRQVGRPITYASIQSVYNKAHMLGHIDLVLIDEAHLVPKDGEGMYQKLLGDLREKVPDMRVAGFTATAFRLDSGRLDQGEGRLFDKIVYQYGIGEGVRDGWLAPLAGYQGATEFDVASIPKRGGEFISSALNDAISHQDKILEDACDEIVVAGADRRSWLLFGAGVDHAFKIRDALRRRNVIAETVTGETPKDERDKIIGAFKRGEIRALTNAQVLTTGFDAPGTDLIALLRPTLSTGLYVQMMGRGTRVDGVDLSAYATAAERVAAIAASGKPNCRVLDYAGNIRRHGPVDCIVIRDRGDGGGANGEEKVATDSVRAKECDQCGQLVSVQTRVCPHCGFILAPPKHEAKSDKDTPVMAMNAETQRKELPVMRWEFARHEKQADPDAPPTLRVKYYAGLTTVSEWLAFEHTGFGRSKAVDWWRMHGGQEPAPETVGEAIERREELTRPALVAVKEDGKWLRVIDRGFDPNAPKAPPAEVDDPQAPFTFKRPDPFADEIPF